MHLIGSKCSTYIAVTEHIVHKLSFLRKLARKFDISICFQAFYIDIWILDIHILIFYDRTFLRTYFYVHRYACTLYAVLAKHNQFAISGNIFTRPLRLILKVRCLAIALQKNCDIYTKIISFESSVSSALNVR